MRSNRIRRSVLLSLFLVLFLAEARGLGAQTLTSSMGRRLPNEWMPFAGSRVDLSFRATGTNARITLGFTPFEGSYPKHLDNIAVVERGYYRARQEGGDTMELERDDSRVPGQPSGQGTPGCCEAFFDFTRAADPWPHAVTDVPFLDTFKDGGCVADPRWALGGVASVDSTEVFPGSAAAPFENTALSHDSCTLKFSGPGTTSFTLTNLTAGKTYVVTGWWRTLSGSQTNSGSLTVDIDLDVERHPPILLVDDDNDSPNVRQSYLDVLDDLGLLYDVCPGPRCSCLPGLLDCDPDPATLARYRTVLWFTGTKWERAGGSGPGPAGPSVAGEDALGRGTFCSVTTATSCVVDTDCPINETCGPGGFLDQGGCLLISSQLYLHETGYVPNEFMQTKLAVSSASTTFYTQVTGAGFFSGLGPYDLNYSPSSFPNHSDSISGSSVAFTNNLLAPSNDAAVSREAFDFSPNGTDYSTAYFGFPLEMISNVLTGKRMEVIARALKLCDLTCPGDIPFHRILSDPTIDDDDLEDDLKACNSLVTEGTVTVSATVPRTFRAGNFIALNNGVSIFDNGSGVAFEIGPVDIRP